MFQLFQKKRLFSLVFFYKEREAIKLKQGFLTNVLANKDIQRDATKFDSGLTLIQPQIDKYLKEIYEKYLYLFDDTDEEIQKFVDSDPFPSCIEDEFARYQRYLDDLKYAEKFIPINCILIDLTEMFGQLTEHVKASKRKLAELLAIVYKTHFDELNDFMEDTECVLKREIKDDEDFGAAIACLLNVYKNSER